MDGMWLGSPFVYFCDIPVHVPSRIVSCLSLKVGVASSGAAMTAAEQFDAQTIGTQSLVLSGEHSNQQHLSL